MNAKLQRKLTNKIAGLFDPFVNRESDIIDQNNVRSMLKYLTSVDIQWWRIWSNVSNEICQYQNQSVKNENFSNSLYSFALFRFSQIKNYTDETENHIKLKQERESILSLIDRAIVHCEIVDRLAPMFMLRSMVLNELNGDIISALYNIEESIKLASDKPIYHIYKAAILVHDGQLVSSLRLLDSLLSNICTVSTEHSAQLLQMIRTEIKQLKCRFNMNQDKLSQPKECRSNFGPDFIELDSRCILMSNSAPTGQRLVANKNIPDGTTILTESSYMMLNGDKNQLMNRCRYCQRNVTHRFWPCSKCTSVVYCDRSCLRQDWNHLTECGIVDLWYENNKNYKYIQYAFRIFNQIGIETLLDLPDSVESFPYEDYLHGVDSERIRLNALLSLQNHCTMITLEDIQRQLISAIDCTMISLFVQGYDIVDVTTNQLHKLISHAYRIEQRVSINLFRLIDQNHSTAMYLMGSMFNHSCNPNLSWSIDDNGILRVITCMPIDSGHDLTINYKPIEISMSFEQRQIQCRQRFFQCNCEICFHQVRNFVSLQCIKCSGPVVVNSVVFDRYQCPSIDSPRCLQCGEPEIDATHKLSRLETLRTTLHFGSQLLTITKDKKDKYIEMLSNIYREIESICYNHSYDLIEDIYAICVALHREGRIDQCVPFGLKVDNLLSFDSDDWSSMPLNNVNSIRGLPKNEVATNFNRNIDHMLFWTHSIFQTVIDREPALKNIYYNTLQRFQRRTIEVIIRSIEQSKSKRLMSKQQLTTIELDEEIKLLEVLLGHERSQFVEILYVLFCLFERCFCRKNIRPKRANGFVERIFTYFFDILIDYDFICKRVQSSLDHQMSNERHLERQQTVQTKSLNEYMKHVIKSISKWISNIYHLKSDSLDPILINVATDKQKESFQTRLPLLNVCLSHNDRRINVTAMISTASTCSLISSDIIDQLHVRPKHIWPILIRESIGRPLQISVRSALVTIESIKQFYKENDNYLDDNDNQTTIKHDLELVVIGTNQFSINNNNNNDGDHNNNRIQLLIGQDILNWSINTLPIRVNHYQIDNLSSVLHFSTQYGRTCMGTASQTMSNNLKLIENVIKYQRKVLPWRKSNQSILSGITRDIEVILGFIFGLSTFAIFDWAFMLIVTISPLLLFLYFCIPSNWFGGMHRTAIRSTIHTIISNGFIVLYGLRLMGNWCCNQTIYSSIDRHTYKPTLMVLIRGKRSETICRVVLDSSEPKSMISRRVLTEIDEILHSSESIIQMEMYSLDDQTIRTNVEFNIEDRIFWDYLPTPSRSLREVISVQHGVSLTDDTDEMLPFGSVDIILGIDQLSKSIYMENEMISIYLGPNLTLQPTRFGWTLTGTHYPLIRKSLQTIYELERRTIDHLSHYLVPFVAFNMICLVLISIIIDLLYIGHLTNRFASHNSTIVTDCAQFMLKSDYVPLLSHWYDHGTRIMSCSIYRETFFRLIPFWPNQSIN